MATITLSITEARRHLLELVKKVKDLFDRVIITKKGKPEAVIMSYEEFEGWLETLDIMNDPELVKEIEEAERDIRAGRIYSYEEVFGKPQKGFKKKK